MVMRTRSKTLLIGVTVVATRLHPLGWASHCFSPWVGVLQSSVLRVLSISPEGRLTLGRAGPVLLPIY